MRTTTPKKDNTMTYSFNDLCLAMRKRCWVNLTDSATGRSYWGHINGIRPEDGSGDCWLVNLHLSVELGNVTVFVRVSKQDLALAKSLQCW